MPVNSTQTAPTRPYRPRGKIPTTYQDWESSLRRAFRTKRPTTLTIGFDYGDLGTFHPTGDYSSMLNSLMGETVKYLPLACEWEEIPEAYKAHIFPTLELGCNLKLRILWRKNKQRIMADHLQEMLGRGGKESSAAEESVGRYKPKMSGITWLTGFPSDRVARSLQNAANRAKNTILTHQGKKSFAQGRNEYYSICYRNLRYEEHKQDQVRAGRQPVQTDQDIWMKSFRSTNRQNSSGKGRKLPGGAQLPRRRGPQHCFSNVNNRERWRILRQKDQEAELLRKQTAEAQQRAYLAALKADAAYQNSETMYGAIDRELAGEDNDVGDNEEADSQQSSGDYSEDEEGDNEEVQDESEESD
ncbi:hypothetical protein Tco_0633849 [Tanacetum coccineum]